MINQLANKNKICGKTGRHKNISQGRGNITNSTDRQRVAISCVNFLISIIILHRDTEELVIWLEAPESRYQGLEEKLGLPVSPNAKNAERIICCTISGVSVFAGGVGTKVEIGNVVELEAPTET